MLSSQIPTTPPPTSDPAPAAAVPPRPLPPLPPGIAPAIANQVLSLFLGHHTTTLTQIAEHTGLPLNTLGQILESPYIHHILEVIARLNARRAEVVAGDLRTKALYSTAVLAENAKREETRRLAASSLLRMVPYTPRESNTAPAPRSAPRHSSDSRSPHTAEFDRPAPAEDELLARQQAAFVKELGLLKSRVTAAITTARAPSPAQHPAPTTSAPAPAAPAAKPPPPSAPTTPAAPAPPRFPLADSPGLLDHLAARMAAPSSRATSQTRTRDAPRAA